MRNKIGTLTTQDVFRGIANTSQITFEITDAYNLRCEYCGSGKFYSDYDERKAKNLLHFFNTLWQSDVNVSKTVGL